jgi:hypothetical protein
MKKVVAPITTNTSSPTSNSDSNNGYKIGFRWLNTATNTEYVCVNDTVNSATWSTVGSVPSSGGSFYFSPVDWYVKNAITPPTYVGGTSYTMGLKFTPLRVVEIKSIRFYWASAGNQTITCKIWDDTSTAVKTVSVATTGVGYYTGILPSSYVTPSNKINKSHFATIYSSASNGYTYVNVSYCRSVVEMPNIICEPGIILQGMYWYIAADARPTTQAGGERYPVEPVFNMGY